MIFDLDQETGLLQRTVREFALAEVAPAAPELDRAKSFPYELVRKMGELGWMGIPFPEEFGGSGGTTLQYAIAVEELTRVDSSVAITMCAHTSLGTQPIYMFGAAEQKQRYLPDLCAGRRLGAFGLTEPEAGSDAGNVRTRGVLDGDEWVIDGTKQFITNAGTEISGHVAITARTGEGEISNIIIENGTPGYEQGTPYRKMGWNASDTRPLSFDGCRVPRENLLGPRGEGFRQFLQTSTEGASVSPRWAWALRRGRSTRRSPMRRSVTPSAGRSASSRRSRRSSPTSRPRSKRRGCSPTRRRSSRTRGATSR